MKLSELIENYKRIAIFCDKTSTKSVILELQGLEKSQKPVVPQFVADWYEDNKDSFEFNVWDWIAFRDEAKKLENREFNNWINNSRKNPIQTLVNMHQYGYEVEKEKRYYVKITAAEQYLVRVEDENFLGFLQSRLKSKFTRKELEDAGFGWVFDCPGIEIEEME
ncbi:TPA: DUF1642 domain-containing protein [Streptococcus pneumoniae]